MCILRIRTRIFSSKLSKYVNAVSYQACCL